MDMESPPDISPLHAVWLLVTGTLAMFLKKYITKVDELEEQKVSEKAFETAIGRIEQTQADMRQDLRHVVDRVDEIFSMKVDEQAKRTRR